MTARKNEQLQRRWRTFCSLKRRPLSLNGGISHEICCAAVGWRAKALLQHKRRAAAALALLFLCGCCSGGVTS